MPESFVPSQPEKELVSLFVQAPRRGQSNDNERPIILLEEFTEYSFNSNFLTPTDGWSFTVAAEKLPPDLVPLLVPGAEVQLYVNGFAQSSGYIDSITKSASRSAGTEWRIEGRDRLGQVVDSCADPLKQFKESQTLLDALKELFGPFGWSNEADFVEDNDANRALKTGQQRRAKTKSSEAKGFGRRAVKATKLHQLRPYSREGVFEFASRMSQRFGLWLWLSADGEQIIVSTPTFDQEPSYKLIRSADQTNVLDGSVKFDFADQPTHIVADSYSHGGEFGKGRIKVVMANVAVRFEDEEFVPPEITKLIKAGAKVLGGPTLPAANSFIAQRPRILYLHDDESKTLEHLENFVRREMALLQRKSLSAHYTVEGHGQFVEGKFVPWAIDTTVDVYDEVASLEERLWVLGRTFNKSRSGGTTTSLELIRLNSLLFSDTGK